jgi:hypothetical protein
MSLIDVSQGLVSIEPGSWISVSFLSFAEKDFMLFKTKTLVLLAVANLVACAAVTTTCDAGTFRQTRTMEITYAWGTSSMAEFDDYETMYPGYLPTADVTFYNDGTFDAVDYASGATGGGIYDKRGKNLEITILPPGPAGLVQYVGRKVSNGVYEGEILVNGIPSGNWRGRF